MSNSASVLTMVDFMNFNEAQYCAGQVLVSLHFGRRFTKIILGQDGALILSEQDWGKPSKETARIALAGPGVDLKIAIVEDEDIDTVPSMMVTWIADVRENRGYANKLIHAVGFLAEAAIWCLAFVEANCVLVDEVAAMLVRNGGRSSYQELAPLFSGRTTDVTDAMIEAAGMEFIGSLNALDLVEEAIRKSPIL